MAKGAKTAKPAHEQADWWVRWPERHQSELAAFAQHGAETEVLYARNGLLVLSVDWPSGIDRVRLRVGFSPMHPFCRPAVTAPELDLSRHQHPLDKGLCLLTQASGEWRAGQMVADLIAEQLTKIFAANSAHAEGRVADAAALEEQAPDPISPYYAHLAEPDSAVFYSADQRTPNCSAGFATWAMTRRPAAPHAIEAVLRKVEPAKGPWFAKPFEMPVSGPEQLVEGRWVRLSPPKVDDVAQILAAADAAIEAATALQSGVRARMQALASAPVTFTGVLFEEELAYGSGGAGDGWLFIFSWTDANSGKRRNVMIRPHRITDDLKSRVPVAKALAAKSALVLGVGAIGSFVALELARAGIGKLTLIDSDAVEPGNSVRWPLGRPVWGMAKVRALAQFIGQQFPGIEVTVSEWKVGGATTEAPAEPIENPVVVLRRLVQSADVVIDATASTECQHAVAFTCREADAPLVVGYATEGAAGGVVARFPASAPACLVCLQLSWQEAGFPQPAVDANGTVTPVGCNQPTFTGAAFDLQEVSMEMVRSAIGLVAGDVYGVGDWQVGVLSLQHDGGRVLPTWRTAMLEPRCDGCCS